MENKTALQLIRDGYGVKATEPAEETATETIEQESAEAWAELLVKVANGLAAFKSKSVGE